LRIVIMIIIPWYFNRTAALLFDEQER
jgi:hypothetical protein